MSDKQKTAAISQKWGRFPSEREGSPQKWDQTPLKNGKALPKWDLPPHRAPRFTCERLFPPFTGGSPILSPPPYPKAAAILPRRHPLSRKVGLIT